MNASLFEQLVIFELMTRGRLLYRSNIVFDVSKFISDRFRARYMHCHKKFVSKNLQFSMRNCLVKIFLKTTRELNCNKSDGKVKVSKSFSYD